jgi:GT2 family glycosyltransferase
VDVVVPFKGARSELAELRARLAKLSLRPGDTILVIDNTPDRAEDGANDGDGVRVLDAGEQTTPGYARNRGAEQGSADWIVFIDADTEPPPDLLDRYFDPLPAEETVLLAGEVIDEPVAADAPGPARYAYLRRTMGQDRTLSAGRWAFIQSSNAACRRDAFELIGGFREDISAAEDADLSYRLRERGQFERREGAAVIHRSRRTVRQFATRTALYGAGAAWLNRNYPGSWPPRRLPGLAWWAIRFAVKGCLRAARHRDRDELVLALYEPLWELAFALGRSRSNERPRSRR